MDRTNMRSDKYLMLDEKLIVLCAEGAQNFILCAISNFDDQIKISFSEVNE